MDFHFSSGERAFRQELCAFITRELSEDVRRASHRLRLGAPLGLLRPRAGAALDVTGLEILGPFAPLRSGSPWAPLDGAVEAEYREHIYFQFAAGGFDITRNVIAARGLGLPR